MKLMLINSVCGIGSTGRIVTGVAHKWIEQGNDVIIVYGIGKARGIEQKYTYKISNNFLYKINNVLSKATDLSGLFCQISTTKLIKKIKEYKPDVIHIHTIHGYYLNFKMLFKFLSKTKIKIIYSIHDCWPFTGHCAHYTFAKCYKWQTECHHCPQLKTYPKSWFIDNSKYMFRTKKIYLNLSNILITTPSQWLANEAKKSILANHKIFVTPPGVDENIFRIKKSNFKNKFLNKKIILFVANVWSEKKGLSDLFKIASIMEKYPEYILVCVGSIKGNREERSNIYYINQTNDIYELVDIYNSAEIFVNLSYEETFGMVTLESMMCGVPLIVYDQTACPEIVSKECGKIIKVGDVEKLCDSIINFPHYDRTKIRKIALKYTISNMVSNYVALYK